MTIKQRLDKIKQVAKTARQVFDNRKGRKVYRVDSTRTGKPYQVMANWQTSNEVKVSLYTFDHKEQVNQSGNHTVDFCRSTVCYQALGALKFEAKQAGKILSLCENKTNAKRLLNFGGELIKIINLGGGVVWGVVR